MRVQVSAGKHNAPEQWRELADAINQRGRGEPLVVQGHQGADGTIRVDEVHLEAGHTYQVEFGGQIVGEVKVTDPVVGYQTNRADRRRQGQRSHGGHTRKVQQKQRWGRD